MVRSQFSPPRDARWSGRSAAAFRIILTPIDTLKTTLQVQGASGTAMLRQRIKTNGIGSLWWGAIATAAATFVGHYPWFATVCEISCSIDRNYNADYMIVQLPLRKPPRGIKARSIPPLAASSRIHRLHCLCRLWFCVQLPESREDVPSGQWHQGILW